MSAELQVGSRLDRFQLVWELGRGGMATVWIAVERTGTGKHRLVALKAMLPKLAQRPDFRSMFLDEGQIVRSIEHPSVVRVYEVGEDQGVLYMGMEWVEGDSLYALIKAAKQRRAIPSEQAVRIIADTAAGLHVAHELRGWDGELRGVVHCDVSPQNILVGLDGQTKLVDFGVAHAAAYSDESSSERIAGKAGYMSPEQARAEPLDRRSDLFSMGIVLFELTTGERLFRGRDRAHTMHLVHIAEIPRPSTLHPDYPRALESIVLKSLERDRNRRFQTAEEFAQALDRYLVEQRVMVARASVGRLLRRVLGDRIDARRQNIRGALQALKEGKAEELVAAASGPRAREFSLPSMQQSATGTSHVGTSTTATTTASEVPASRLSTMGASQGLEADATPGSPRSSAAKIIAPALILAAGAGAYWWVQQRPPTVTRVTVAPASQASNEPEAITEQPVLDRDAAPPAIEPATPVPDELDVSEEEHPKRLRKTPPTGRTKPAAKDYAPDDRSAGQDAKPAASKGDAGAKPAPKDRTAAEEATPKPVGEARPVPPPVSRPEEDLDLTNPYR
jgi:serine/threonine protein kinase